MAACTLSVIVPALDEAPSLPALAAELVPVLERTGRSWEAIIVDDGSRDETAAAIRALASSDPRIRGVFLDTHQGKAAALAAGFAASSGETIVTLDADLQDDPNDLARFLEKLDEGYDLVCGWKRPRRDPLRRRLSSRAFNAAASLLLGPRLHDHNCGFKAYRRPVLEEIALYGDLHRFATVLAGARGFRVAEIVVNHRPRRFGESRYGPERIWRSMLDLLTVTLLVRPRSRAFGFFAGIGCPLAVAGLVLCAALLPAASAASFSRIPLFLAGILAFLAGVQLIAAGLICELALALWRRSRPEGPAGLEAEAADRRPAPAGFLAKLRGIPHYFLGRYGTRPLHFFGSCGAFLIVAGLALGIGVKLSAIAGHLRYFLMELALGFSIAGIQLFIAGLVGELLVSIAHRFRQTRS